MSRNAVRRHVALLLIALCVTATTIEAQTPQSPSNVPLDGRNCLPEDGIQLHPGTAARIELVFALDSTGSMGGLIEAAKQKIWSIANVIASAQPTPEIRIGLLTYRDRGDDYVTRVTALSANLDAVYGALIQTQAGGGGDGPESVNQALHEAVTRFDWTPDSSTLRLIFLVGDAPPHMDYADDVSYAETTSLASGRGIVINTIQCGASAETTKVWRSIASRATGEFFQIAQSGGTTAVKTPYDAELARHARLLDGTLVPYGTAAAMDAHDEHLETSRKIAEVASTEALADRAAFKAGRAGTASLTGRSELVRDSLDGSVRLEDIPAEQLPEQMRGMSLEERRRYVEMMAEQRRGLREEVEWLSRQRRRQLEEGSHSREDAFDQRVVQALRCQASRKGISLENP
jgi:hypothetical protein